MGGRTRATTDGRTRSGRAVLRGALTALLTLALGLATGVLGAGSLTPTAGAVPGPAGVVPVVLPQQADPDPAGHGDDHELHEQAELTEVDVFLRRLRADQVAAFAPEPAPIPVPTTAAATTGPVCTGVGDEGLRVQAVLAHTSPTPDPAQLQAVADAAGRAEQTFVDSALRTGGVRHVRWVTTDGPDCDLAVLAVRVSPAAAAGALGPGGLFDELVTKGLTAFDRKYLVWTQGEIETPRSATCGIGEYFADDRPVGNLNTKAVGPTFGAMDPRCWDVSGGHSVPAHELMHMLGAVQDSAPHATADGHCTDDYDALCYGPSTVVVPGCTSPAQEALFDCNGDDYFNTDPPVGSYLCRQWNTARSLFLHEGVAVGPLAPPGPVTASVVQGQLRVSWGAPPTCPGPDAYVVEVGGRQQASVGAGVTSVVLPAPAAPTTVRVTPSWDGRVGPAAEAPTGPVQPPGPPPTRSPVGQLVYWGVDGRRLAMFGYALDPDLDAPVQVVVVIDGVGFFPFPAQTPWAEVPRRHPGYSDRHAFLRGFDLPPGSRNVCVVAADLTGDPSTNLGCFRVTVK